MGVGCTWEISVPSAQFCFEPETEVKGKFSQSCQTLCNPMDCSLPGSLSMGFPRQEYWSGLPFPPPGDLPDPRIKSVFPALAGRMFTPEPLEQVVDKGLVSLFPLPLYECPIVSASFIKKRLFFFY